MGKPTHEEDDRETHALLRSIFEGGQEAPLGTTTMQQQQPSCCVDCDQIIFPETAASTSSSPCSPCSSLCTDCSYQRLCRGESSCSYDNDECSCSSPTACSSESSSLGKQTTGKVVGTGGRRGACATTLMRMISRIAGTPFPVAAASQNHHPHSQLLPREWRRYGQLLVGVLGVYAAYLTYGLVTEQLYSYRSPADGGAFRFVWFLQVLESTASICLGLVGRAVCGRQRQNLPLRPFFWSGVSQGLAKVFTGLALAAGTSYPVLALSKSAKVVPVMLGQLLLGGSSYNGRDYAFAGLLVTGTVLLSLGTSHPKEADSTDTTTGIAFVVLSLVMDGCTGGLQKKLKRDTAAAPPTTYDFVLYTHCSMLLVALLVAVGTGDLRQGVVFVSQNPPVALRVAQLCLLSVLGQSFIFYVISCFDPLVCATVTTTRKMWSVLLSIVAFQHQLTATGYAGLTLALSGLVLEVQGKVGGGSKSSSRPSLPKTSSVDDDEEVMYNKKDSSTSTTATTMTTKSTLTGSSLR